jgi:hypothetical protein
VQSNKKYVEAAVTALFYAIKKTGQPEAALLHII